MHVVHDQNLLLGNFDSHYGAITILEKQQLGRLIQISLVGWKKSFSFLLFSLLKKNLFLCKQILFLLRQLFLYVQSQNKSCFFTIKTFFYMMHRMSYFDLDTWHLLFDKLSHNDKPVSFFCNSFDSFSKFNLSIHQIFLNT